MLEHIRLQTRQVIHELLEIAGLVSGQVLVVGCSSSEMLGQLIGKAGSPEAAQAAYLGMADLLKERGIWLAAQCCEHLNRALVVESALARQRGWEVVNALPTGSAGGSFPMIVHQNMEDPVLVAKIQADAGLDIGGTLIGMHLKQVAVPLRLSLNKIGEAHILCARTRPPYTGGPRATYREDML